MQASTFPVNSNADTGGLEQHKWYLSERLGRDVGREVAEMDYRENVQPTVALGENGVSVWFIRLFERLAATHGMRALAQVQYNTRALPFVK